MRIIKHDGKSQAISKQKSTCIVAAPMSCSSLRRDSSRPVARTRTPRPKRRRTTSKEMLEVAPRMRHDFGEGESAFPPLVPMQRAPENGAIALKEEAARDLRRASIAEAEEFTMPQ